MMKLYLIWGDNGVLGSVYSLTTSYAELYGKYMFGNSFSFVQLV
jgi:hypothetical protein